MILNKRVYHDRDKSQAIAITEDVGYCDPKDIKIVKQHMEAIPRPIPEQYESIKQSIKKDGQQDPVVVNEKMELIDGYTRLKICKELGIRIYFKEIRFEDRFEELKFSMRANLHRRQLKPFQKVMMYQHIYEEEKRRAQKRIEEGREHAKQVRQEELRQRKEPKDLKKPKPEPKPTPKPEPKEKETVGRSAEVFGKAIGVNTPTVVMSLYILKHARPHEKKAVLNGEMTVSDLHNKIKNRRGAGRKSKLYTYEISIKQKYGSEWKTSKKMTNTKANKLRSYIKNL
ncbi:MAG: ParB N-terminal domain-containing protein [Nitrosopumilaceae archaeon]|nr:ParB N-terminal domain-containing protein [Nitrosopumilaceae archaeon]